MAPGWGWAPGPGGRGSIGVVGGGPASDCGERAGASPAAVLSWQVAARERVLSTCAFFPEILTRRPRAAPHGAFLSADEVFPAAGSEGLARPVL